MYILLKIFYCLKARVAGNEDDILSNTILYIILYCIINTILSIFIVDTTNIIESVYRQFRTLTKTKGAFPNDNSLLKLLFMGI